MRTLWQVTGPHFTAGLVTVDDHCVEAAPILKWEVGKSREELRGYFKRKRWRVVHVREEETSSPS